MVPARAPQYDVFVAYADQDASWVYGQLLPALGLPDERSITKAKFVPGAPLASEFERAVKQSRYTILVLTPAYLRDEWTAFGELLTTHATLVSGAERLVPVLLEDCEIPLRIDFRVRLDCRSQTNWAAEIGRMRDVLQVLEPSTTPVRCPYPGIRAFGRDERGYFFGREREIGTLAARVQKESFILVLGPSGSGKSSLVFSGLVPRLEDQQPGYWVVRSMRPGERPIGRLAACFDRAGCDESQPFDWKALALAMLPGQAGAGRVLLIIDQLEEVFSRDTGQGAKFASAIQEISSMRECVVVLTLRADFYAHLLSSGILPVDPSQQMNVLPLRGAALREAIVKPAEAAGVWLEEKLVDRLLADAANEPGILPMLQETMILLWGKIDRRLITLTSYLSLDETRPGLMVALGLQGAAAWSGMTNPQRTIARRILLRLVQFGEGRADTRRQQRLDELRTSADGADFQDTSNRLVEFRILTIDSDPRQPAQTLVDLAHEALITGWPLLNDLVRAHRDTELTRRRLLARAESWDHRRKSEKRSGLLDAVELAEATAWLHSAAAVDVGIDALVAEFIAESRRELQRKTIVKAAFAIAFLAVVIAGLAIIRTVAGDRTYLRKLEAADQLRANNPMAALQSAINLVTGDRPRTQELAGRAATLLQSAIQTAEPYGRLSIHGQMFGVAFSRDGKHLAAVGTDGGIVVRDLQTDLLASIDQPTDEGTLYGVQISPDSRSLVAVGASGAILAWDLSSGGSSRVLYQASSPLMCLAYSADGNLLAAGGQDGVITVRDLAANTEWHWQAHHGRINRLVFSANRAYLAAAASDDPAEPADLAVQKQVSSGSTASVWEVATRNRKWTLGPHERQVTGVAFDDAGRTLVTVSSDGHLRTWDLSTGRLLASDAIEQADALSDVSFIGPAEIAISHANLPLVTIWDLTNHRPLRTIAGDRSGITSLGYYAGAPRMLATACLDGKVRVYYLDADGSLAHARVLLKVMQQSAGSNAR